MISFDLACSGAHVFEVWFRSSADFDDQAARSLIICPVCGDDVVSKAVMAPNVSAKGNQRRSGVAAAMQDGAPPAASASSAAATTQPALAPMLAAAGLPAEAAAMLAVLAKAQAQALPQSRWVGRHFAEEARVLHAEQQADESAVIQPIHGQATRDEAEALAEEGIAVMPLLVPVIPPELQN